MVKENDILKAKLKEVQKELADIKTLHTNYYAILAEKDNIIKVLDQKFYYLINNKSRKKKRKIKN